jgi:hypothetical protein
VALVATGGASAILLWRNTGFYFVDVRFSVQAYLFLLLALLSLYAYSRPFSIKRLKAWWEGKPEPKPAPKPKPHEDEPTSGRPALSS